MLDPGPQHCLSSRQVQGLTAETEIRPKYLLKVMLLLCTLVSIIANQMSVQVLYA